VNSCQIAVAFDTFLRIKEGHMKGLAAVVSYIMVSALALAVPAVAAPGRLDWGAELHSGPSACPSGNLVVNVVQKVVNDADSGTSGNAWAFDDFVRQIQVVDTGAGGFCATVKYEGNFTTVAGPSPGAAYTGGTVADGIVGTFQGGYVSTLFTGTLKPGVKTKGSIGTYDYQCDTSFNCPGAVSWPSLFFDNLGGFDIGGWWGWTYHGGSNGTWVNAITGNSGDIQ
jgi:hypothetical protein